MTFVQPKRELTETIGRLVEKRFEGNYQKAFAYFDRAKDGTIDFDELLSLFTEAEWGNVRPRPAWAQSVLAAFDTDDDDAISWIEFECGFTNTE